MRRVAIIGSSGLVGEAITRSVASHYEVAPVAAPRLQAAEQLVDVASDLAVASLHSSFVQSSVAAIEASSGFGRTVEQLAERLQGASLVVHAAGLALPGASTMDSCLLGANGVLPLAVLRAAEAAAIHRLIHVSSAAVCRTSRPYTDELEDRSNETAYKTSKSIGELVLSWATASDSTTQVCVYRPTSLLSPGRDATRRLAMALRWGVVPVSNGRGVRLPCCTTASVGRAVRELVDELYSTRWAGVRVRLHPDEGVTAATLYSVLGMRPSPLSRVFRIADTLLSETGAHRWSVGLEQRLALLRSGGWASDRADAGWGASVDSIKSSNAELAAGLRGRPFDGGPKGG